MKKSEDFPKAWVFLRGLTRASFHWLGFQNHFKENFQCEQVYTPELAGNGLLFEEVSNISIDLAVEQLRSQIDLKKNQKLGLFTISMGGMIGARWAEMYPNEITHLVLTNTSFSSLSPFYHRLLPNNYVGITENFLFSNPQRMEEFIMKSTSNLEEKWRPCLEKLVQFQKTYPVSLSNFMRQLKMSGQAEFQAKPLAKTLILSSFADKLVSRKCSEAIAHFWNVEIESHPTAGHDLAFDDPDWIFEKISEHF